MTELFNRAAEQLGDERLEVRLAAIYVLRKVGKDFPDFADPAFELLQAYLRERQARYGALVPPADIRAAMDTVQMRVAADAKA